MDGIDDEITILRVKIKSILEHTGEYQADHGGHQNAVTARKDPIQHEQETGKEPGRSDHNIIRDIGVPLGVEIMSKKTVRVRRRVISNKL